MPWDDGCSVRRYIPSCQRAGRPRPAQAGRGKSGLHGTTVPGNARPVLARVSRESATERIPPAFGRVRSKGCGKSAPRRRQRHRHGKPHRVQDRIGAAYGPVPARRPGWLLEGRGNSPPRGMVAQSSRRRGWTKPGLQALWHFLFPCEGRGPVFLFD